MARPAWQIGLLVALGASTVLALDPSRSWVAANEPSASPATLVRPGEPWIVFQQFSDRSTVTLVRPDGTGLHSPTDAVPGGDQTNPDWSPDGSQLVFARAADDREDLWVVDADGTDAHQLTACEGDCVYLDDPDWSPDGRTVLFSRLRVTADGDAIATLEWVDVASGATSVIVQADPGHFYAGQRWSPDGRSVVLEVVELDGPSASSEVVDVSLAVIDLAAPTSSGHELLGSGRFPETAAWTADGSSIVFGALEAAGAAATDLFLIGPDGTDLRRLTALGTEGGSATHPDVAADGTSVIFTAMLPGGRGPVLGRVGLDGGEILPATGDAFLEGVHPRQRPVDMPGG